MKLHSVFRRFQARAAFVAGLSALALLASCNYAPKVDPYRMEILQGNLVTQEMVAKLAVGQTKEQVRFALGTPLVVDSFRDDRWDYVFLHSLENSRVAERRRITVFFEEGRLKRIAGDVVSVVPVAPQSAPAAAPAGPAPVPAPVAPGAR